MKEAVNEPADQSPENKSNSSQAISLSDKVPKKGMQYIVRKKGKICVQIERKLWR